MRKQEPSTSISNWSLARRLTLVELVEAIEDGQAIEVFCTDDSMWLGTDFIASRNSLHYIIKLLKDCRVRIKPKLKPVDLSVLVGSGIDCEFCDNITANLWSIGILEKVTYHKHYISAREVLWQHCRPRMNRWMSLKNVVNVVNLLASDQFEIEVEGSCFRIEGLQDGYCWPWEE